MTSRNILGLALISAIAISCSNEQGSNSAWSDLSQIPENVPELGYPVQLMRAELIRRGDQPSQYRPAYHEHPSGYLMIRLFTSRSGGGLDFAYHKGTKTLYGPERWERRPGGYVPDNQDEVLKKLIANKFRPSGK